MPSVQQERTTAMSSTCSAMRVYRSDTHRPLCPYCLNVRLDGMSPFFDVPGMAVNFGRIDSGMGWPAISCSFGLGSNRSAWLGPPSMKSQITELGGGAWCGCLGGRGSGGGGGAEKAWLRRNLVSA